MDPSEDFEPLPGERLKRFLGWVALIAILAMWIFGPWAMDCLDRWMEAAVQRHPWLQHLVAIGLILFLVPFHVLLVVGVYECHRSKGTDKALLWTCGIAVAVALILYWLS